MAKKNVESEVRRLENRVAGAESVNRLIFRVQMNSLAKAEQLRLLALAAVNAKPGSPRARGTMDRLRWFVEDLAAFHKHPMAGTRKRRNKGKGRR